MYIIYTDYINVIRDEVEIDDEKIMDGEECSDGDTSSSNDGDTSSSSESQAEEPYDRNWDINNTERFTPNHQLSEDDKHAMALQILLLRGDAEEEINEHKIYQFISTCSNLSWRLARAIDKHQENQQRTIEALSITYRKHKANQWKQKKEQILSHKQRISQNKQRKKQERIESIRSMLHTPYII